MNHFSNQLTLRCRHCGQRQQVSLAQLVERLRELGFLRREAEPSQELALELARSGIEEGHWGRCEGCGQTGLGMTSEADEADDPELWGDARHCEQCRAVIPAERVELFPASKLCAKCQNQVERGQGGKDSEYCPHCGSVMQLKAVPAGSATYRMYCPACRKAYS